MANIVITSTATTVGVDFGVYASVADMDKASFRRDEMSEVIKTFGADHVTVVMLDGNDFDLSYTTGTNAMVVDTVDGVTPTDNNDLYDKIVVLQQV